MVSTFGGIGLAEINQSSGKLNGSVTKVFVTEQNTLAYSIDRAAQPVLLTFRVSDDGVVFRYAINDAALSTK